MQQIILSGLKVDTLIGVYDWERTQKTTLIFDITVDADLTAAMASDNVSDTIDYAMLAQSIQQAAADQKGILIKKAFASGHLDDNIADPVQESLNQILGTAGVSSIIAGTINPQHLRENVEKARRACGE